MTAMQGTEGEPQRFIKEKRKRYSRREKQDPSQPAELVLGDTAGNAPLAGKAEAEGSCVSESSAWPSHMVLTELPKEVRMLYPTGCATMARCVCVSRGVHAFVVAVHSFTIPVEP